MAFPRSVRRPFSPLFHLVSSGTQHRQPLGRLGWSVPPGLTFSQVCHRSLECWVPKNLLQTGPKSTPSQGLEREGATTSQSLDDLQVHVLFRLERDPDDRSA